MAEKTEEEEEDFSLSLDVDDDWVEPPYTACFPEFMDEKARALFRPKPSASVAPPVAHYDGSQSWPLPFPEIYGRISGGNNWSGYMLVTICCTSVSDDYNGVLYLFIFYISKINNKNIFYSNETKA
jgi:hypothetical protein